MKHSTLKLTQVFKPQRGDSKYTKAYGVKHAGAYPVYSAAIEPLTFINTCDYDGEYLTWNTNGFGGYISILKGKFSINGDRGMLIPLRNDVDLYYVAKTLQGDLRKIAKGRLGDRGKNEFTKVSLDTITKKAFVTFPLAADGKTFDLDKQRQIAEDFKKIDQLKDYILTQSREMRDSKFDISLTGPSFKASVADIFDLDQSTNSSNFTKKFVNQHQGDIPVYSASNDETIAGYGYVADNLPGIKYFENILTWNIDGSVGQATYRSGRFSLSEKVIPLMLKPEWDGKLDLEYLKFTLEEKAAERGFGYSNKAGKSRISDIEIEIPTTNGELRTPDISKQNKIAQEYKNAYQLRDQIVEEFNKLASLEVSYSPEAKDSQQ